MSAVGASALFVALLVLAVFGKVFLHVEESRTGLPKQLLLAQSTKGERHDTLFVLLHGFRGDSSQTQKQWREIQKLLNPSGDVLNLIYPAGLLSNTDPQHLAQEVGAAIQHYADEKQKIVLIGHSIGSLILRRAYIDALNSRRIGVDHASWTNAVSRIVILAGMNRGWDVSGHKPSDMRWSRRLQMWGGAWFAQLTGAGKLILSCQTGRPFVENLRLEWMSLLKEQGGSGPEVVQLLGDIDDVVSDEDNKDLRVAQSRNFVWLRVRGTGHLSIIDLADTTTFVKTSQKEGPVTGATSLGEYRKEKLLAAATEPWTLLRARNEELPFESDSSVRHIVFVVHGIRDLGEWAATFEQELQFQSQGDNGKIAIVSVRYGYFGMGQFLLQSNRDKYVRWFMDQYTETLARYPNAGRIDFIGHSNGTYLLASALEHYRALKIDHIVFGGSVVRADYDWGQLIGRVRSVRNYIADKDWVVALFPRFFEAWPIRLLGNEVGSAGFNGFTWEAPNPSVTPSPFLCNVQVTGGHSAFLQHTKEIARYLTKNADHKDCARSGQVPTPNFWLKATSDYAIGLLWIGIVFIVIWLGIRVTAAASSPAWPMLFLYVAAVFFLLRWV